MDNRISDVYVARNCGDGKYSWNLPDVAHFAVLNDAIFSYFCQVYSNVLRDHIFKVQFLSTHLF